ncbi:MAG: phospholipase D-like domain-containing protein, partial [Clostridiales bacterium]
EIMYQRMLEELAQAENFIFLEFFIIENGRMWQPMLEILEQKAQAGVDVRVIYDDYGSLMTLPSNYDKLLEKKGIKCRVYNRFKARLSSQFNTRDHRKICVVDGDKGFVGGINLADEYINLKNVYGHWHDCGLFVAGQAVAALSAQFLTMWSLVHGSDEDYQPFLAPALVQTPAACAGFFQPYTDNPLDEENVGESVYLNIINRARNYVYISSPFLVIDNELIVALTTAAKSGVDVRIITPRVGAAAMSYVSRSYYEQLIRAGLHIYEYLPGYIHSKTYVCDDRFAVVGSINMDYRSLYLSHENAVWICDSPVVNTIRDDYDKLLAQSIEITLADCHRISGIKRLLQAILRLFSPLA